MKRSSFDLANIHLRYDMDFNGSFWSSNAFVRDVYNATLTTVSYPPLAMEEQPFDATATKET